MQIFNASELNIPYAEYKKLYASGKCRFGVNVHVATQVTSNAFATSSGIFLAFLFFNTIAIICFLVSIYLSFTWAWWAFFPGFLIAYFIMKLNGKSNAENVLRAALQDEDLYNDLRSIPNSTYLIDQNTAQQFLR